MTRFLALFVLAATFGAGCQIIINENGDDDGQPCAAAGYDVDQSLPVRDPETGVCEVSAGCGGARPGLAVDWAQCASGCEGLDEFSCTATDGCRATYLVDWDGWRRFNQCWGVAPSGPVHGECYGLGAYECSRHDDCAAVYAQREVTGTSNALDFQACEPEVVCGAGAGDALVPFAGAINPYTGFCEQNGGGGCGSFGAPEQPTNPDWAACETCAGYDEATCLAADGCRAAYAFQGFDGDELPPIFATCLGTAPITGPIRGGECYGLDAYECSRHDDCSVIYDWTMNLGFMQCTPEQPSVPLAPACAEVGDEATCIDLTDGCLESGACNQACEPLYQGADCECAPSGCSCNEWTFTSCRAAGGGGGGGGGPCGEFMCSAGQYCSTWSPGAPNSPVVYTCQPMPDTCVITDLQGLPGPGDCACLGYPQSEDILDGCACEALANGFATVKCWAP